jgi:hypothetical protein
MHSSSIVAEMLRWEPNLDLNVDIKAQPFRMVASGLACPETPHMTNDIEINIKSDGWVWAFTIPAPLVKKMDFSSWLKAAGSSLSRADYWLPGQDQKNHWTGLCSV